MSLKTQRVSNKPIKDIKSNNKKPEKTVSTTSVTAPGAEQGVQKNDKKNAASNQETEQAAKRVRRAGTAINDATDVSIVSVNSTGSDDHSVALTSITSAGSLKKASVDADLQFNLIAQPTVLGAAAGEGESNAKNSKPKGTKLQRLQKLLAEAEKKRARMKQLTAHGGEEGLIRLQGEKWNDALKSARGEKTLIVGSSSIEGSEGVCFLLHFLYMFNDSAVNFLSIIPAALFFFQIKFILRLRHTHQNTPFLLLFFPS